MEKISMVFDYAEIQAGKSAGYAWTDRRGNLLKVPDDSWDPILKDRKASLLRDYLISAGYDGPGDWNPY